MTLTKHQLATLLFAKGPNPPLLSLPDGRKAIFLGASREDGSGSSFNLRVLVGPPQPQLGHCMKAETVYVRTVD